MEWFFKAFMAFVFGLSVCAFFGASFCYIPLILFFVAFLVSLVLIKVIKVKGVWFFLLFLFFGASWFCLNIRFVYYYALSYAGETKNVVLNLKELKEFENGGRQYVFGVKEIEGEKSFFPFKVKVNLYKGEEINCDYYDDVKTKLKLEKILKDSENFVFNSNISKNIFLKGKVASRVRVVKHNSFFAEILKLKDYFSSNVNLYVKEPYNFFVNGIIFGDISKAPYKFKRIIKRCGISHVFAVSGLHITILSIFIVLFLKFLRCPGLFSFIFLFLFLLIYSFMVGFTPSVLRACFMNFVVYFFMFFNKKISVLNALFFAAFIILLIWPMAVLGLSFLLSFSAVIGIVLFKDKIKNLILRKIETDNEIIIFLVESFSTSVSAMFLTSIFLMFVFRKISIVAPFVNLFVVPFLPILYVFSLFVAIFGFFSKEVASFFGSFCEGVFGVIFSLLSFVSKFPFCYFSVSGFFIKFTTLGISTLIFIYLFFLNSRKIIINKRFLCFLALMFFIPLGVNFFVTRDMARIYVFKKPYGVNSVIKFKGKTVVINSGQGNWAQSELVEFLEEKGIKSVDILILNVKNKDSVKGDCNFLKEMPPKYLIFTNGLNEKDFEDEIDHKNTKVISNKKFFLKLAPISIKVYNKQDYFKFYLNFKDFCLAYSNNLEYFKFLKKDVYVDLLMLEDKKFDVDELKNLNCFKCLVLDDFSNEDFKNGNFEFLGYGNFFEFMLKSKHFKRGEN